MTCRLLLVVIAILSASEARRCLHGTRSCGWHRYRHRYDPFDQIANDLIRVDRRIQSYCESQAKIEVKEIHGPDNYKIRIPVGNINEDTIQVKIKHRLLHVSAVEEEIQSKNPKQKNIDFVRVLPDNVVTDDPATWYLNESELGFVFPYKTKMGDEYTKDCDEHISYEIKDLPRSGQSSTSSPIDEDQENMIIDN